MEATNFGDWAGEIELRKLLMTGRVGADLRGVVALIGDSESSSE